MTTLRLLIALLGIVPRIAWAWLKTKTPRRECHCSALFHCRDCGWALPWDTASLICGACQKERELQKPATAKPAHEHTHNGMEFCRDYESCTHCHCHLQDEAHTACCKGKAAREMYARRQAGVEHDRWGS